MAKVLRKTQENGVCVIVMLVLLAVSGCATPPVATSEVGPVTLVNPKTGKTAICPEGLYESRSMTEEQAAQQVAWHSEFRRAHNRLPTPMEGCLKLHEILGFVRKLQ